MSTQKIETDLRHAIWMAHARKCVYCSEPLQFAEVDIDHVIPETLVGKAELPEILTRLGLPLDYDLLAIGNLLPAHRRCNRAKTGDVLNEGAARFFLHRAVKAAPTVARLISGKKHQNDRDILLARMGEAFRSGLIQPIDIGQPHALEQLRLSTPLRFADNPDEEVMTIRRDQVEAYLDRPVLMGGSPQFTAGFGNDGGVRMEVRTVREYRAAQAAGFHARTTYDIKSEAFLKKVDAVLHAAKCVGVPLVSHIRDPHRGVADLDLLPVAVLPRVSPDDEGEIKAMRGLSIADLLSRGEIKVLDSASGQVSLEWNWGLMLRELGRADFDGDGIEDILCECYCWATEGTLGFGWTMILKRTTAEGLFEVQLEGAAS